MASAIALTSIVANAQSLDSVIARYIDALGGKEKLLALKTVVTDANMSVQGTDIGIKMYQSHNIGQRVNITAMGTENYIIQTPTSGWKFLPVQGQAQPEASPEAEVKESADGLDLQGPLVDYQQKGHKVELVGREDIDGASCYKIKTTLKGGAEQTIYIEPKNYYIVKIISKSNAAQGIEQTQTFSDYRKLESGYVFPFAMTGFGPGELTINKIDVNVPVDEAMFKPSN